MGGRTYPVVLPSLDDPRLHLAAVIVTLQVLGQAVLHFEVSVAQILVSVGACALIELAWGFRRERAVIWPASALLTGNGVAFILRVNGTRHGDWFSLRGAWIFVAVGAVSLLSKYVVRVAGRHVFNPSNVGLVLAFLVLGSGRVNPQDLWWGHFSPGLALTLAVIAVGGVTIARRMHLFGMAIGFWATFAAGIGVLAATGHCMTARWHVGPLCGTSFWLAVALSPEVFVFLFFMITDPRTSPTTAKARVAFGCAVGAIASLLVAPARTEFWTKVAILGALLIVCALRPALERAFASHRSLLAWPRPRLATVSVAGAALSVGALVVAGAPARGPRSAHPGVLPGGGRPAIALPPLPPAALAGDVHAIDASLDQRAADRMARDVVTDLLIAARARTRQQPALLATAATGAWLQHAEQQLASDARSGEVTTDAYRFARLTVVVIRDPRRPQAAPVMGIEAAGTVRSRRGSGGAPPSTSAFDRTFAVTFDGREFLIAGET